MPLSAQLSLSVVAHETSSGDLSRQVRVASATYSLPLTDGSGANQAQVTWTSSATAGGATPDELIVQSLPDDRGTVNMSAVKIIYLRNKSASYRLSVTVDNWTTLDPTLLPLNFLIPAGGCCVYTNPTSTGWTTTASSAFSIVAEGAEQTVDYDILLIGEGTVS